MHPIEQLRYVARTSSNDAVLLAAEAAHALASFNGDNGGLLLGTRQLLKRQPLIAPLWWVGSHLGNALNLHEEAYRLSDELRYDATASHLAAELPDDATVVISGFPGAVVSGLCERPDLSVLVLDVEGQGFGAVRQLERAGLQAETVDPSYLAGVVDAASVVINEATAVGDTTVLGDLMALSTSLMAAHSATPHWMVTPVGRALPASYVQEMIIRAAPERRVSWLASFETLPAAGVTVWVGPDGVSDAVPGASCPELPELLR